MLARLLALIAAFFAGMWWNERQHRQAAEARLAPLTTPKPVDRRPVSEVIPALQIELEKFDTKSSLVEHFIHVVREGMSKELTPKQAADLGSDLIAIMGEIEDWESEQRRKMEGF